MSNYKMWRGISAILCMILACSLFLGQLAYEREGDINLFLKIKPPTIEVTDSSNYFSSDYADKKTLTEAIKEFNIQSQEEGSVLLKNNDNTLPLQDTERSITLFGRSAADPVFRGGTGGAAASDALNLYDALTAAGFSINNSIYDALSESPLERSSGVIAEVPGSFYTESLQSSYANDFNDVAIVVLSRFGGEENDLYTVDSDGVPELSLHQQEKDMLNMIKASGKFGKTIVLVNSGYAMDLGWLDEYEVDACLWIGYPGKYGFTSVANVLTGVADPSGRLVDTYAAESLSAPAMRNFGDFKFDNMSTLYKDSYVVYAEGIYTGYKYYETRYQDSVLGINNADGNYGVYASQGDSWNYADEMVFPFGHGLSYANFTQKLESLTWDKATHTVTATVNVTNDGAEAYSGKSKSVVELYVQLPYTSGNAQKSAIQLIGFGKTGELAAGESETVTVEVSDYIFATYDRNAINGADSTLTGSYVFDAGDYYFAIGNDSHDALNNVLAARGDVSVEGKLVDPQGAIVTGDKAKVQKDNLDKVDNITYAKSPYTGEIVSNHFDEIDLNYFYDENKVTYLSRDDWSTYPSEVKSITETPEMKTLIEGKVYENPSDAADVTSFVKEADNDIKFIDMKDVEYSDEERWNSFIDQLSIVDLAQIPVENMGNDEIPRVDYPANLSGDGPDGYQSGGTLFVAEVVSACTWSEEMLTKRGDFMAEEALYTKPGMMYSPGANMHRTQYAGRNFEYYSEDGVMSYYCGAYQVKAMAGKGLLTAIKHFVLNDQETNRHGVSTFMTEQTYREGGLKGFEGAFAVGGSLATMTSFGRIGCVPSAADYNTMTLVLRNEWGFKGINLTDSSKDSASYMYTAECLAAGTDMFNNDAGRSVEVRNIMVKDRDGFIWERVRDSSKHFFYAYSHSNITNGLSSDVEIADFTPWWKTAIKGAVIGIIALSVVTLGMFVYSAYFWRKKKVTK